MSNGSQTRYDYAIQPAYEAIPGPGDQWDKFRFNGGGPNRATNTEEDPEIGGTAASVTAEAASTGTMDVSLWYGQLDPFLEIIFGADFAGDVLTPGGLLRYFTLQESQPDLLAGDKFTQFINGSVTSFQLTLPTPNGRITGQLGVSFSNGASSAASIASATPDENTSPVMRTGDLVTDLQIDDLPVASYNTRISQLVLNFTRETADEPQIDVEGRGAISYGDLRCEIGITAYDENRTLVNTLFQNVSRKFEFSVRDVNGKGYDFLFPSATPNGGEVASPAKNTTRTQTLNYSTSDIQITRVP